jgi:hypothetical protein
VAPNSALPPTAGALRFSNFIASAVPAAAELNVRPVWQQTGS